MSAYDCKLHEQQRELEALEARLARQEKMVGVAVIVAMILAGFVLALITDAFLGGEWSPEDLSGFIP